MENFQNKELVKLTFRRRIPLLVFVLLACILAYIFSGPTFIRPKYKSTAVLYPVNIIPYSNESPTEQLLQLCNSADVRAMMINRFGLFEHYGIDSTASSAKTKLNSAYDENVIIRETEFESIKIDIYDADPDTACSMVNGLIDCVNLKARALQRDKTKEVVRIYRHQLDEKTKQLDSLSRLMSELRVRYGLLDYGTQSKEVTKSYLKLIGSGATHDKFRDVDSMMRNLEEKGGLQISLNSQLNSLQESYNGIKIDYDKTVSDLTKELTYSNVVTRPRPADSKSYPMRMLIVFVAGLSALLLCLVLFTLTERMKTTPDAGTGSK
ncbi:MAG: hypothetical protein HY064_08665 [Bacteroidetes bacterium]|nr:hypothetical protein [Bacteroidota bacterium]